MQPCPQCTTASRRVPDITYAIECYSPSAPQIPDRAHPRTTQGRKPVSLTQPTRPSRTWWVKDISRHRYATTKLVRLISQQLWTDATTHCGLIGAHDGTERTVVAFDPGLMLVTRYDADAVLRLSG